MQSRTNTLYRGISWHVCGKQKKNMELFSRELIWFVIQNFLSCPQTRLPQNPSIRINRERWQSFSLIFFSMFPILVVDLSQSTYLILLFNSLLLSYMHCNVFSFHFTTIFLPFFPSFVLLPRMIYILYFPPSFSTSSFLALLTN